MNMRSFRQAKNPALPSSIFSNKSGSCPGKEPQGIHFSSLIILSSPEGIPITPVMERTLPEEKDLTTEGTEHAEEEKKE